MNKKRVVFVVLLLSCLSFVACAPKQAEPSNPEIDLPVSESLVWSPESNCALCHVSEADLADGAATTYSLHAAEQEVECVTCHSDGDALSQAHVNYATGTPARWLKTTKVSPDTCLGECHGDGHDQNELRVTTANSTILTDSKGTTVNPHNLPENDDHVQSVTCLSCHVMHAPNKAAETAPNVCLLCHHENVYECYTCHS